MQQAGGAMTVTEGEGQLTASSDVPLLLAGSSHSLLLPVLLIVPCIDEETEPQAQRVSLGRKRGKETGVVWKGEKLQTQPLGYASLSNTVHARRPELA